MTSSIRTANRTSDVNDHDVGAAPACAGADDEQLARLADTVLTKSPYDLAALVAANPAVAHEWIAAFGRAKAEAEAAVRFYSAAMASLSTVRPIGHMLAAE